jgi:hypothetical protein
MKRLLLVGVVAFGLAGCTTLANIGTGISLVTKSVTNPVTKAEEAQIEIAADGAVHLLQTYKADCAKGIADKNCRSNVAQIQVYTRKMAPLLSQLRSFVDDNDQINASVVYNQLAALYTSAKSIASAAGVNVGSLP